MVQRVVRQIKASKLTDDIIFATSVSQKDIITNQLGEDITIVTEPCRRDTFPAIALATSFLSKEMKCNRDEVIVVMPCDTYTEAHYFDSIRTMAKAVEDGVADLVLMGIKPTYPSAKYGYVVPESGSNNIYKVNRFTEKPDVTTAEKLIAQNAFWNGGVFAFKLGYLNDIVHRKVRQVPFYSAGADAFICISNESVCGYAGGFLIQSKPWHVLLNVIVGRCNILHVLWIENQNG
jgi:mannose-1-phosphate guanylyltransferase